MRVLMPERLGGGARAGGLSLVEVIVSIVVVSVMLVAALNTVSAARVAETSPASRTESATGLGVSTLGSKM